MSTPGLASAATQQTEIDLTFTAGSPTGAPAGFSLQWMTLADYMAVGGWPLSDAASGLCKGSFSGNASLSRYNLTAGQSVTVQVGDFLFDNGASVSGVYGDGSACDVALKCNTTYVFRAFSHANSTYDRSLWSTTVTVTTNACNQTSGCTYTIGYWKTHGIDPTGNNANVWPVQSLTLGSVTYDQTQLQAILNTPASGNGLIALAHQLIAVKLNAANGADTSAIDDAITQSDALIGGLVVPSVGSGYLAPSATSTLTGVLDQYNNGLIGPGHCE